LEGGTNPDNNLLANELLTIINQLPEGKKTVFNLYVVEGYSHKEIAEMLGISEGTSKSQLAKAKEILAELHKKHNASRHVAS
jgi:RNA polymerase sigma-70 factor (ECF subfamily)